MRRRCCCARRLVQIYLAGRWQRLPGGPKGGPSACSWLRCRYGGAAIVPVSSPRSAVATATSWITWPRRCSTGSRTTCLTFLLETSVLERLSGELCDAVTSRTGSQAMLEDIERAGLFLTPLDEVRGWWRYRPLFADLLRVRLQQDQPGVLPALHRAAAAWFEARGLVHEAIEHALAANEAAWAARASPGRAARRSRPSSRREHSEPSKLGPAPKLWICLPSSAGAVPALSTSTACPSRTDCNGLATDCVGSSAGCSLIVIALFH